MAVANRLHVGHVLEGSVRKSGNTVRISAQLVQADTDTRLWSETYDRELSDIFATQDDIAARHLEALKVKFDGSDLPDHTTQDAKAYEYFLRGQGYAQTYSEDGTLRAVEMLRVSMPVKAKSKKHWIAWKTRSSHAAG